MFEEWFEVREAPAPTPAASRTDPFTDRPLPSRDPRPSLVGAAPELPPGVPAPPVHALVADLQAAVTALADAQADGRLATGSLVDTAALLRTAEAVAGLALVEVAGVDRSRSYAGVGRASAAGWVGATLGVSESAARAKVGLSRRLTEDLAPLGARLCAGGTTVGHCSAVVGGLRGVRPEVVSESMAPLLDLTELLDPPSLHRELRERALAVSPALAEEQQRRQRQRVGLTASELLDGCVSVHGLLAPEGGQALLAALDALVHGDRSARGEDGEPDVRDAPARRADALAALAQHALGCTGALPEHAGSRAQVHVVVRAETLLDTTPGSPLATFAGSHGVLTRQQLLRLACDADVSRVVLDAGGAVLDLGRQTRTVTPAQYRALVARDRGCVVRGCRRRHSECQAHHVQHWALGGPSDLGNYALVCHLHHHQLHEGERRLEHRDGRWLTPDGYDDPGPAPPF